MNTTLTALRAWTRPALLALAMSLGVVMSGCRLINKTASLPMNAVSSVVPGSRSSQPDAAALQVELQRFADEFAGRTIKALDDYAQSVGTDEARRQVLQWKVSVSAACVSIASGPNPTANLLDFLALATITRTALEEDWVKSAQGRAFQPWLNSSRTLETNAWKLAEGILEPGQQQELRDSIQRWWVSNAGTRTGFFTRPQEFTALIRQTGKQSSRPDSVFNLAVLDPTLGLDPAVREVTLTRLFAERAMFTAQRMPFLVRWQFELLTDEFLRNSQVAATLTNAASLAQSADRLSLAVESGSQTAAELPDRITAEREAILKALETQEGKLRELSGEVTRTLAAGEKMSTSLNQTIITFDALMKRFGVGEPSSGPPDTNSAPFNILDYGRTADQITAMARELDVLIKDVSGAVETPALDKRIADLNALSTKARVDAKSVLNHAFLLAAGLVLLAFACAVVFRRACFPPGKKFASED